MLNILEKKLIVFEFNFVFNLYKLFVRCIIFFFIDKILFEVMRLRFLFFFLVSGMYVFMLDCLMGLFWVCVWFIMLIG